MSRSVLAATVAALSLSVCAPAAQAAFPGENGPLVFDLIGVAARVEPDGTGFAPITDPADDDREVFELDASADGTHLAMGGVDGADAPPVLATMQLDDSPAYGPIAFVGTRPLLTGPRWLRDGRIVYQHSSTRDEIGLTAANGTGAVQDLTAGQTYGVTQAVDASDPVPSPDGTKVFFQARRSVATPIPGTDATRFAPTSAIWVHDLAAGTTTAVTGWGTDRYLRPLDVAPDGSQVLVAETAVQGIQSDVINDDLQTMVPATGARTTLKAGQAVKRAVYSPDGTSIAYMTDAGESGTAQLRIRTRATGAEREIDVDLAPGANPGPVTWAVAPGITVTETSDEADSSPSDGVCDAKPATGAQCTLRASIQTANATPAEDRIAFDVGSAGAKTIAPTTALPAITHPVELDGTTQPHASDFTDPPIALNGAGAPAATAGLRVQGEGSTIRGLDVFGFKGAGIVLAGDGGHAVEGSWIGFKRGASGFAIGDGNASGIDVQAPDVRIGGPEADQANVVSANGNRDSAKAYVDDLKGKTVGQGKLHDDFAAFGTGVIISSGDAARIRIEGNLIGPDPDGGRFGAANGLTSTFGVMVGPEAGINEDVDVVANTLTGNLIGVIAVPDGTSVVDGLAIRGNRIGVDPDGTPGDGLGGIVGVALQARVTNPAVTGNTIGGTVVGVAAQDEAVRIQGNQIGADEPLGGLAESLTGDAPQLGAHNLIGVALAGTERALVGGAGPLGNKIVGNVLGVIVDGAANHDNAITGNTIGLGTPPSSTEALEDVGSVVGVLMLAGTDNAIGDAGAGNTFYGTGYGAITRGTTDGHVQANRFVLNVVGHLAVQADGLRIGGTAGQGNTFAGNVLGTWLVGWAPTEAELQAAGVQDGAPVRSADRELAFEAPVGQGGLGFVGATTPAGFDDTDVAVALGDPPGGGGAARRRATGSTGTIVRGNRYGVGDTDAVALPNTVGLWLFGAHTDTTVADNTIARNRAGGLWLGTPVPLGSAVPEPSGVRLSGNRVFENYAAGSSLPGLAALGFDLLTPKPQELAAQAFGPDVNDPLDADGGANGRQNHPVVEGVTTSGATTVTGSLASKPNTAYDVELFANARCNAFGSGEGEVPLGIVPVTTDGAGSATFSLPVTLPAGRQLVSATATGPEGTSELSSCTARKDGPAADAGQSPSPAPVGSGPGTAGPKPTTPPTAPKDGKPPAGGVKPTGANPKAGDPIILTIRSNVDAAVTASGKVTTSGGASSSALAAARVTVALRRVKTSVKAGKTVRLKLKPTGKKAIRRLKRAVKRGAKATATVTVVLTDKAGNRITKRAKIKLRR